MGENLGGWGCLVPFFNIINMVIFTNFIVMEKTNIRLHVDYFIFNVPPKLITQQADKNGLNHGFWPVLVVHFCVMYF